MSTSAERGIPSPSNNMPSPGHAAPSLATDALPDDLPAAGRAFVTSLRNALHERQPYDFWLLTDALPDGTCEVIADLPFRAPSSEEANFDGRRNTNDNLRVYFNPENQEKYPVMKDVVAGFNHPYVRKTIEDITGTDLSDAHLRVEFCQDTPGFWLEPHTDISVKKFSMLIYLVEDPDLTLVGTDILQGPPHHEYVTSAPYGLNKGVIFIPGENTWHAAGHHPIPEGKVRKSIMINYVTSDWREKWELA